MVANRASFLGIKTATPILDKGKHNFAGWTIVGNAHCTHTLWEDSPERIGIVILSISYDFQKKTPYTNDFIFCSTFILYKNHRYSTNNM